MNKGKIIELLESESEAGYGAEDGFVEGVEILALYGVRIKREYTSIYFCKLSDIIDTGITEKDILELRKLGWFYYKKEDALACFI